MSARTKIVAAASIGVVAVYASALYASYRAGWTAAARHYPPPQCSFDECRATYEEGFGNGFAVGIARGLAACNGN